MKKFLSMLLALTFLVGMAPMMPIKATETVATENEMSEIQSFVNESKELLSYETEPVYSTESVDEENSEIDFSSCRLILKSTKKPDKLNSVGIADGFKDYYIVQFKNEIDTKKAYGYYSEKDYVTSVGVDTEQNALTSIDLDYNLNSSSNLMAADVPTYDGVPNRLNSWGSEAIGAYAVKDYITNNFDIEKREVVVAVCDTGIDLNHEYFSNKQDRLERTNFTLDSTTYDDETDVHGHGTAVTSVILDSTPNNVKVRNYKISEEGVMTTTDMVTGILKAATDEADIINCSFGYPTYEKTTQIELFEDALEEVYNNNILIVCAAGNYINEALQPLYTLPSTSDYVISVTGLTTQFQPTFTQGWNVDIAAPGVNIPCAWKGAYKYLNGTSFASPLTASVCASMLIIKPQLTPENFIDIIKETATPHDKIWNLEEIFNIYGTGYVDAIEATGIKRPQKVVPNVEPGKYEGEIVLTLTAPNGGDIYYTKNTSYPTKEKGTLYTEPLKLYGDQYFIKAVTYDDNGIPSPLFAEIYRSSVLEDENKFEIDDNGVITKYNGDVCDIIIPETVDSIEVKNIAQSAFMDSVVTGITLPETVSTLGFFHYDCKGSFYDNQSLIYIDGESVKEIGHDVFNNCSQLWGVNFPNCKKLGDGTFMNVTNLNQLLLPKVENIGIEAFFGSHILKVYMPELKSCAEEAFKECRFYDFYAPKFSFIEDEEDVYYPRILYSAQFFTPFDWRNVEDLRGSLFGQALYSVIYRIEFSKLKTLHDLPGYYSTLVLPSTVETFPKDLSAYMSLEPFGNVLRTYTIYGSAGTLVEKWAKENEIKFIEVTPETAVVKDLPKYYKPYMGDLMANVVGFNKEYQWYAHDMNSNEGGRPIEGATDMYFNPATYPDAKYYYCEVISQDVGYEPITIKTSACENRMSVAVEEEKSCITNVTYEPSRETRNTFTVTVDNRPAMIQFVEPDGGTRTYDRSNKNVSIKSYDAEGNEVNSLDRNLAYEVWEIYSNMSTDVEIKTRAKYLNEAVYSWDKVTYSFTVKLLEPDGAVRSVTPAATSGRIGAVETTVVTGPDAEAIRFVMPNGTTATYAASKATALANGDLQFVGKAWMNNVGTNTITVQVKVNGKWQTAATFTYTADDYPVSA